MQFKRISFLLSAFLMLTAAALLPAQQTAPLQRPVGVVKSVTGNTITMTTDAGDELNVRVDDSTRIVRTSPDKKDLKDATTISVQEVQPGDRVLVRGKPAEDGKSLTALSVVVMKQADIAARQQQEREDWQKRGVGGLVSSVDASAGTVTLANTVAGIKRTTLVKISPQTIVRRYAPDSVKFDDAKPSSLAQVKPGDQLRARGARNADGTEIAAEEVVSGSFRNIAGLVSDSNAAGSTLTLKDILTGKSVTVKITADSQLKALPAMAAQMIAARLKGASSDASKGESNQGAGKGENAAAPPSGAPPPGRPGGRSGDMQQMLNRMPDTTLADLHKGDAVMMVTTEGQNSEPKVITLLTGVDAILTASPKGGAMLLSPWNLGGGMSDSLGQ